MEKVLIRISVHGNFETEVLSVQSAHRMTIAAAEQGPDCHGFRHSRAGFTLLELLVVIAIFGIVAGVVSLSVAPGEHRRMAHEVDRLAALFRLAHDETRVSGRPIEWIADADGYRFVVEDTERSGEIPDGPLRPREWPFTVKRVDAPVIVFGREPLLEPVEIRVAGPERVLMLHLDEFGTLSEVR